MSYYYLHFDRMMGMKHTDQTLVQNMVVEYNTDSKIAMDTQASEVTGWNSAAQLSVGEMTERDESLAGAEEG